MDFWSIAGLLLLAILVIWGITFTVDAVGKPKRRREGTGEFEKYGPDADDEYIALVDKRDGLYGRGLRDIRNSRVTAAESAWREASELGSGAATMALGMLAYRKGDRGRATSLWESASSNGDVPAALFLALMNNPARIPLNEHSGRALSVSEFIDEIIDSECGEPASMNGVIGVALEYGYKSYADKLAVKRDSAQRSRS